MRNLQVSLWGHIALFFIAGWLGGEVALAQPVTVLRDLDVYTDTLRLGDPQPFALRPFIWPGSEHLSLAETALDTTQYRFDYTRGLLWISLPETQSSAALIVRYRTLFAYPLQTQYARYTVADSIQSDSVYVLEELQLPVNSPRVPFDPFGGSNLQRSGSITRGIIAGNRQDVTVESGLNLRLGGEITEGVNLEAVLTDANTPIQPEGNTQRLSDFDRVFIELQTRQGRATLGDFDLQFTGTEFAPFQRKLQGASVVAQLPTGGIIGQGQVAVAGAISRGLFRVQMIPVLDGVQGPYRLEGAQGEPFIIVIAGSERVYLDGQLLTRGASADYIVDYATGELTFTATRLMTSDMRLSVEFEYTVNQFTRSLIGSQAQMALFPREEGNARVRFGATYLREADGSAFQEEFGLSAADSLQLVQAGDAPATQPGEIKLPFQEEPRFVQYVKKDTLFEGQVFQIFTPATARVDSVFQVRFTRVPQGTGDYQRVGREVNGILYEWVGPNRGEYVPLRLLPQPKRQHVLDLHATVEPVAGVEIFGEWAQSLFDRNRLSPLDAADDVGGAYVAGLRIRPVAVGTWGQLSGQFRRRFTGAHFTAFDRIRPIEFGRRWNLPDGTSALTGLTTGSGEGTTESNLRLDLSEQSFVNLEWGQLAVGEAFSATRWGGEIKVDEARLFALQYRLESIANEQMLGTNGLENGTWLRQWGRLSKPLIRSSLVPALEIEHERRLQKLGAPDSLHRGSFGFLEIRPSVTWRGEALRLTGQLEYRSAEAWDAGLLADESTAWTGQAHLAYRPDQPFEVETTLGYRVKQFTETFRMRGAEDVASVVMQLNSDYTPFQRAIQVRLQYEALTEKTPILQETFLLTGVELGAYVWEDANDDGIRQVDEFIPERTPNEGTYYRTLVPSDSLFPVIHVRADVRLTLDPARIWRTAASGWKKALAHIQSQTRLRLEEQSEEDQLRRIYLLQQQYFRSAENSIKGNFLFTQRLDFFRTSSKGRGHIQYTRREGVNRTVATQANQGFSLETRFRESVQLGGQLRAHPHWHVGLQTEWLQHRTTGPFVSRNFDITSWSVQPEVGFTAPNGRFQLQVRPVFGRKDDPANDRAATVFRLPLDASYNVAQRFRLALFLERANVQLTGDAIGLSAFELTDGRGAGTSYLWRFSGDYLFSQLISASLAYDGRAPADGPVLHTVRVQVSARF